MVDLKAPIMEIGSNEDDNKKGKFQPRTPVEVDSDVMGEWLRDPCGTRN